MSIRVALDDAYPCRCHGLFAVARAAPDPASGQRLLLWIPEDGAEVRVVGRSLRLGTQAEDFILAMGGLNLRAERKSFKAAYGALADRHLDAVLAAVMALPQERRDTFHNTPDFDDWMYDSVAERDDKQRGRLREALASAIAYGHFGGNTRPVHPRDAYAMARTFDRSLGGDVRLDKGFLALFDRIALDIPPDLGADRQTLAAAYAEAAREAEAETLKVAGGAHILARDIKREAERLAGEARASVSAAADLPRPR